MQMKALSRRTFMHVGGLGSAALGLATPGAPGVGVTLLERVPADVDDRVVRMIGDGVGLSPAQYARLLTRLADENNFHADSYSLGGVVEQLEARFARVLGKEQAVFMPTGTLANQLAVRALAGGPSRVIVQEESHYYQDEGDCAQTLSGLTLIPLAAGRATFRADDVQRVIDQTNAARVVPRVSVIAIETPVRRRTGERFDASELQNVVSLARREGIRLHLDGARLFLQAAYTGEDITETVRPFDTVYVSLYKYFNAASGAILAGPRDLLRDMFHVRRMFGGGLATAWPFAAAALHYFDGFAERFASAVRVSEELIRSLAGSDRFSVERISSGTNLFRLRVESTDPVAFQKRLAAHGVLLAAPQNQTFLVGVNETFNRMTAGALADVFKNASV
jgi:threonine aldolase